MDVQRRVLASIIALTVGSQILAAQTQAFVVRLSPVPIDIAGQATVAGTGAATATLTERTLVLKGTFEGLRTPATIARLHAGLARGVKGPIVAELTVTPAVKGTLSGRVDLTQAQLAALNRGALYLQLHSEKAPDGNLWGWLLPQTQGAAR